MVNIADVGARIKLARKQKKITQEKLAELIHVSAHYVYEIERGSKAMSIQILYAIAEELEISADYLLFGENPKRTEHTENYLPNRFEQLTENLSLAEQERLADILGAILPHLKQD